MHQIIYNQEFNESKVAFMEGIGKTDSKEISYEEREFLKVMKKKFQKGWKTLWAPITIEKPS